MKTILTVAAVTMGSLLVGDVLWTVVKCAIGF